MKTGVALLLVLALTGCGEDEAPGVPPPAKVPADPEAALAWVEQVDRDPVRLRARLDAWPQENEAFVGAPETQIAWTWRLQLALRDGDVEHAADLQRLLTQHFEGRGQYPPGRGLRPDAVRLGLFEEALRTARRRIEGVRPDPVAARSALDVAAGLLFEDDSDDRKRLAGTSAWVRRTTLAEVLAMVGLKREGTQSVQATLLVLADDFTLGESLFFEVLKQWTQAHAGQLEALLVPVLRGQVRYGLRLVPAESREAELASIAARGKGAELSCTEAVPVDRIGGIGLREGEAALVLADGKGRIVARLSGRSPDPREIEPALQRVLSR